MRHQTSTELPHEFPNEVTGHAEAVRARQEAARMIAARRYWQRTRREAAIPFAERLRQEADLSR